MVSEGCCDIAKQEHGSRESSSVQNGRHSAKEQQNIVQDRGKCKLERVEGMDLSICNTMLAWYQIVIECYNYNFNFKIKMVN